MTITGKDGKTYDTVEEAQAADVAFDEAQAKAEEEASEKKSAISKRKKELSDNISTADAEVSEALKNYDAVYEKAQQMITDAKKEAKKLVDEAAAEYRGKVDILDDQIKAFNDEFGTYRVTLTGDAARSEYKRISKIMDDFFRPFPFLFW